jgi:hypothetical protein
MIFAQPELLLTNSAQAPSLAPPQGNVTSRQGNSSAAWPKELAASPEETNRTDVPFRDQ